MEQRSQFTFYESFYHALSRIKKKADRASAYDAICAYALFGIMPDVETMSDSVAIAFELVKPNLDASRRKAESGKKGGESKQTGSKVQANGKQTGSKAQANAKQTASKGEKENEIENEIELEKENECYSACIPASEKSDAVPTLAQVEDFARERNSAADPRAFFDYYEQGQWRDATGKPVRNWQQKFVTWEMRDADWAACGQGAQPVAPQQSEGEQYREDLVRMEKYLAQLRSERAAMEK